MLRGRDGLAMGCVQIGSGAGATAEPVGVECDGTSDGGAKSQQRVLLSGECLVDKRDRAEQGNAGVCGLAARPR